ncbi:hypothetical protein FJZ27_04020 [Candidatus Peribacteria bacterium]|nr:hypothetical protein [Candidatus Peribacteria bacterium]
MLRSPRRDRFAPHLPLERERREAAFADDKNKNANAANEAESVPRNADATVTETPALVDRTLAEVRVDISEMLPTPETPNSSSAHTLRSLLDASLTHDEQDRLEKLCDAHGITRSGDAQQSIEAWAGDDAERRAQVMRAVMEDPHLALALVRGLQDQAEAYKDGIGYILGTEDLAGVTGTEGPSEKRENVAEALRRYDVYARITGSATGAAMMSSGQGPGSGHEIVRQWIDQASPDELRNMGIPIEGDRETLVQRLSGVVQSVSRVLHRGVRFWGKDTPEGADDEKLQMDFNAVVNRQIVTIKRKLAKEIEREAKVLNEATRRRMADLTSELGITDATTLEANPEVWKKFAEGNNADFSIFLGELGGTQAELKRVCEDIETSEGASSEPIRVALKYLEEVRGKELFSIALERAKARTESIRTWAAELVRRYQVLQPALSDTGRRGAILARLGDKGEQTLREIDSLVQALTANEPELDYPALENVQRSLTPLFVAIEGAAQAPETKEPVGSAEVEAVEKRFEKILPRIATCEACAHLGADDALRRAIAQCKEGLKKGDKTAMRQLQELSHAADLIDQIRTERIASDEPRKGYVRFREKRIIINPTKCRGADDERIVEDHEYGHLILHILTEDTGLLLSDFDRRIAQAPQVQTGDGRTLEELLKALGEQWGFPARREAIADFARERGIDPEALEKRKVLEEAYCRYGTYKRKRREIAGYDVQTDMQFSRNERALFMTLDRSEGGTLDPRLQPAMRDRTVDLEADMGADQNQTEAAELAPPDEDEKPKLSIAAEITKLKKAITSIEQFLVAFPSQRPALEADLQAIRKFHEEMLEAFRTQRYRGMPIDPETDHTFRRHLEKANEKIKKQVLEHISNFDNMGYDLTKQPHGRRNWWQYMTRDIRWLSIMDYVQMAKEASEDIQRLWKRRGEASRAKVGKLLTQWISNKVPYIGQLQYEFHRRDQQSELDAVGVWEKALENVDPYSMQESLAEISNQDHLKATLIRLTKLGRLDWNDVELWRALGRLSHFQMPEEPCKRDQQLRDFWLKKCIEDIWGDKALYYDWKQANDGGYDSGKSKFGATVDDLSNIGGGIAGRMEMQLRLFTQAKERNEQIPNDVNPHLYERCLHYAMTNGKCKMEDKMYYLVQGVASGLLPLDRLRYLAGEGGKILNVFPFIDYFYQHNNTLSELRDIASKLKETTPGDEFKPGAKTTLWFHLEVLRDESVRMRISKAISGERFQNIDHEDVPALMSQANYGQVNDFTGVISGQRYKLSNEGMKNAYVGCTTRLGLLAMQAKLAQDGKARFGPQECREAARTIITYMHFDNTMTRNGSDGRDRSSIEWEEMEKSGPSTGSKSVANIRDGAAGFINAVFGAVGQDITWGTGVSQDDYLAFVKPNYRKEVRKSSTKPDEKQQAIFATSAQIAPQLERLLLADPQMIQRLLINFQKNFVIENEVTVELADVEQHFREQQ